MRYKTLCTIVVTLALTLLSCGCAILEDPMTERLLVQVATGKVIEKGQTVAERNDRAQRIMEIAGDARYWLAFDTSNLGDLRGLLVDRVGELNLSPSDRILALGLIDVVLIKLNDRTIDGTPIQVPPDYRYRIDSVFQWVEEAAATYIQVR
jgi:hypothetical protein